VPPRLKQSFTPNLRPFLSRDGGEGNSLEPPAGLVGR
jgi:hypothetical protein